MRHNSDTSIALSTENRKSTKFQNTLSKHNPRLKENQKCLTHFKKDNLSQIEENYEPSLGMSIDNKKEEVGIKLELNLFQKFQSSSRISVSPVADHIPFTLIQNKGGLNLIRLVSKFIRQLKTQSQLQKYKIINYFMISLIADSSAQNDLFLVMRDQFFHQSITKKLTSIFINIYDVIKQIPTFQPDNLFLLIFKFILFVMLIINITYIPFELFWNEEKNLQDELAIVFDTIPAVFCIFDGVFRLLTSYYSEGVLYNDKKKIAVQYLKQDFFIDFFSIFPIFFEETTLFYLKIFRIVKLKLTLSILEEILCLKQSVQCYWELLKSIFFIVYFCHFLACIWHKIGQIGIDEGLTNWLVTKELNNTSILNQYCFSLYFIVITTLTIGYGDILPTNVYETLFTMCIAFTGCSVLGYTINNIGEIFKGLNEKEQQFKQQMKHIQQYLKQYKINQNLSLQIRKYFEYHIKSAIKKNNNGEVLMNQLSKQLKEKMQIDLYKKYLMKAKIVKDCCSQSTIDKLCQQITIENYFPESQIFKQQQFCDKLYYVLEGQLEIYVSLGNDREVSIVESVGKDQFIGQWEFLLQSPYQFSLKAKKLTKLLAINRNDFTKVMKENQEDFENYCQIKDQILFQTKTKGSKCYICGWIHYFDKCPFVFLSPNNKKILQKAMKNQIQNRDSNYQTRRKGKNQVFKDIQMKRQAALEFIQESENSDLTLNYLLDLGFNKSDSILQVNSNYFEELTSNKLLGTHKGIENDEDSDNSCVKPQVIGTYKNRSIVSYQQDNIESFQNIRNQTNDQLNGTVINRRNTRELSKIKQSQPIVRLSIKKLDSKITLTKKNDISGNIQSQISSNLNNVFTTNNNIYMNQQNDNFSSQYNSSQNKSEPPSSVQVNNSFQAQNQVQINCTNLEIDKTFIFKNYFQEYNLYQIVQQLIQLQQIKFSQIYKSPMQMHKSYKLQSGRSFRKKIQLSQQLNKDNVKYEN